MTETGSLFAVCAAAMGLAQVADCRLLLSNRKMSGITATAFSATEWLWGAACLFALIKKPIGLPLWLPAAFVAYLTITLLHAFRQMRRGRPPERFELTRQEVLAGGLFGALYAAAALAVLAGLGAER